MTNIILHGAYGKMGRVITEMAAEDEQINIVAGVDVAAGPPVPFPVFARISDLDIAADVIVDFSLAVAVDDLLDFCGEKKIPCVLCTTGLSKEQQDKLLKTTTQVAILKSANMSLGINLLLKMLKEAAVNLVGAGFDIEIVEKHHNLKIDAPSGTALALGAAVNEALGGDYTYIFDRSKSSGRRQKTEIGFSAVRGGSIVGEHEVIFAGADEVVTFSHTAYSKAVFAKGALQAAKFLKDKPPGLYTMADIMER